MSKKKTSHEDNRHYARLLGDCPNSKDRRVFLLGESAQLVRFGWSTWHGSVLKPFLIRHSGSCLNTRHLEGGVKLIMVIFLTDFGMFDTASGSQDTHSSPYIPIGYATKNERPERSKIFGVSCFSKAERRIRPTYLSDRDSCRYLFGVYLLLFCVVINEFKKIENPQTPLFVYDWINTDIVKVIRSIGNQSLEREENAHFLTRFRQKV